MTPTEWNQFILVAIVGVPFAVVFGGPFAWRALVMLLGLALFAAFPIAGMLALAVWLLRTPLRWFAESLIIGFAGGLGARIAGTFNSPERAERDRERWEDRRRR